MATVLPLVLASRTTMETEQLAPVCISTSSNNIHFILQNVPTAVLATAMVLANLTELVLATPDMREQIAIVATIIIMLMEPLARVCDFFIRVYLE